MEIKNDRSAWLKGPSSPCEVVPASVEAPSRLVLLGPPGAGKGTQADLLKRQLHACHLSTGDIFRAAGSSSESDRSPAIKAALEYMRRGALVPDGTVCEIVRERIGCLQCGGGFILDGFPRTLAQAVSLKQLMEKQGLALTAVVNYELASAEIISRLSGRRTCENCKAVFHIDSRPSNAADRCDRCGGRLLQREDDRPEAISVRLEAYAQSTAPLIEFYKNLGLLIEVDAAGSPEQICAATLAGLRHLSGGFSPAHIARC